ncbi:conserved hypothetical protein [Vibrio harveyi]|nr:conserved hypothetical protein [Vibrio harveyi]
MFDVAIGSMTRSQRALFANSKGICLYTLLPILDLDPLSLQIAAASTNQVILADPSISRLLGYIIQNYSKMPHVANQH